MNNTYFQYLSILLFVIFFSKKNYSQTFEKDYKSITSKGSLPSEFVESIDSLVAKDLMLLKKGHNGYTVESKVNEDLIISTNYELKKLFHSGYVLFNDTISSYVNKLKDNIVEKVPFVKGEVKIFVVKSTEVNAYCFANGNIFVNTGLIAKVENEAQLAYIICHEISHYIKKHSIKRIIEYEKINKKSSKKQFQDKELLKYQYSKENELEADSVGFSIFEKLGYSLEEAEKALKMLQYSSLPFDELVFDKKTFETSDYILPNQYFLENYNPYKIADERDDSYLTHPNIDKRRIQIGNIINAKDSIHIKKDYFIDSSNFEFIREVCRFESCQLFLVERDYLNAFKWSYLLLNKYPNNKYLTETFNKGLYGLTLFKASKLRYNTDSYHANAIPDYTKIEGPSQQVNYFFNTIPSSELCLLSMKKFWKEHLNNPDNTFYLRAFNKTLDALFSISKVDSALFYTSSNIDTSRLWHKYYRKIFFEYSTDSIFLSYINPFYQEGLNRSNYSDLKSFSLNKKKKQTNNNKPISLKTQLNRIVVADPNYDFQKYNYEKFAESDKIADKKKIQFQKKILKKLNKREINSIALYPNNFKVDDIDAFNCHENLNLWLNERVDAGFDGSYEVLGETDINNVIDKYQSKYVLYTSVSCKEIEKYDMLGSYVVLYAWGWLVFPIPFMVYNLTVYPKDILITISLINMENGEVIKSKQWSERKRNVNLIVNEKLDAFILGL